MRRVVVWSFVAALAAGPGSAAAESTPASGQDSPAPASARSAAPRATLVQVLGGGKQALVLDRNQGTYVVVRVGDRLQGFAVLAIESDQLVIAAPGASRHYVLPLVAAESSQGKAAAPSTGPVAIPLAQRGATPLDPYATPGTDHRAVSSLMPGPAGIVEVVAPPGSRAGATAAPPASTATAPDPAAPRTAPAPAAPRTATAPDPAAARSVPAPGPATTTDEPPRRPPGAAGPRVAAVEPPVLRSAARRDASEQRQTLSRRSLDAALADFTALGKEMKLRVVPDRGFELVDLARGSLPHRLGLRAGDVVLSIAGRRITSVDAAAAAYVALDRSDSFAIVVDRDGKRLTFRYTLTP